MHGRKLYVFMIILQVYMVDGLIVQIYKEHIGMLVWLPQHVITYKMKSIQQEQLILILIFSPILKISLLEKTWA